MALIRPILDNAAAINEFSSVFRIKDDRLIGLISCGLMWDEVFAEPDMTNNFEISYLYFFI